VSDEVLMADVLQMSLFDEEDLVMAESEADARAAALALAEQADRLLGRLVRTVGFAPDDQLEVDGLRHDAFRVRMFAIRAGWDEAQ